MVSLYQDESYVELKYRAEECALQKFLTEKTGIYWPGRDYSVPSLSRIVAMENERGKPNGHFLHVFMRRELGDENKPAIYRTWRMVKSRRGSYADVMTGPNIRDIRDFTSFGDLKTYMETIAALVRHNNACVPLNESCYKPVSYSLIREAFAAASKESQDILDGETFVQKNLTEDHRMLLERDGVVELTDFRSGRVRLNNGALAEIITPAAPVRPGDPLRRFYVDVLSSKRPPRFSGDVERMGPLIKCDGFKKLKDLLSKQASGRSPKGPFYTMRGQLILGSLSLE